MNWFKNLFKNIGNGIKYLLSPAGQKYISDTTATVEQLVQTYTPLIEMLASLTPTTADDKIVAIAKAYGASVDVKPGTPFGTILQNVAQQAITKANPRIPSSVVNLAIETAVQVVKAKSL